MRRVFRVFLQRNIPTRNEVLVTYVDGQPFARSTTLRAPPYRVDQDPQLMARWGRLTEVDRGEISTPGGRLRFLAVPVRRAGAEPATFAVGIFRDREEAELNDAITALAGVGLALLLAGTVLAWRLAGGVLRPVRAVTSTARSISATSLEGAHSGAGERRDCAPRGHVQRDARPPRACLCGPARLPRRCRARAPYAAHDRPRTAGDARGGSGGSPAHDRARPRRGQDG